MPATWDRLDEATETVRGMLEELGLDAYLFEVHVREGRWEVRVECGAPDGPWQMTTLEIDGDALTPPDARGPRERDRLLDEWRGRLDLCAAPRGEA